jgi:hypothetical protein
MLRSLRRVRPVDWAILLPLILALVAAAPFLTRAGLPHNTDAELHVYRAAELGRSLQSGIFYPRWAPNLYLGYGYPIFNYYAPFTYYLANAFDLVPGFDIVAGTKAVFVLGLFLAALGSYELGRVVSGPKGGVLSAALFVLAPYVVLIDPHIRGDLAEHFALCLLPVTLAAHAHLLLGRGTWRSFVCSVLSLALLVFSHNLLGLVAAVILFALWVWTLAHSRLRGQVGWLGPAAFATAAALIAFFWLPALLERHAIELNVVGPGHFDFRQHFLAVGDLLRPMPVMDLGASAPKVPHTLGLAQWILALSGMGAGALMRWRRRHRQPTDLEARSMTVSRFVSLAGCGLLFLMLKESERIWELVPGMAYLQFPWRLLGPANLLLAVAAAPVATLLAQPRSTVGQMLTASVLLSVLLLALPALYPPMWNAEFGGTGPADIIFWELRTGALGTTSTGDFVPRDAAQVQMKPVASLVESYERLGPVDKVNRPALPQAAQVDVVEHSPNHDLFRVFFPEPSVLRLFTFHFPGWHAYVDDQEVPIEVAYPEGFITVRVPEGDHSVLVRFEDTWPRRLSWYVSLAGLVALVGTSIWLARSQTDSPVVGWPCLDRTDLAWLGGIVLFFMALKSGVVDPRDNWMRYTSPPSEAWAAQNQVRKRFGKQIELIGYDLPRGQVPSGQQVPLTLYWYAPAPPALNYQTFVHISRPTHVIWGQEDHLNPGGLPTKRWVPTHYVWDSYKIDILPGTPPGRYALSVGLYSLSEGWRLPVVDGEGNVIGDHALLGSIDVTRPRRQPALDDLALDAVLQARAPSAGVTLLGFQQSATTMEFPGSWQIVLFWRADRDGPDLSVRDIRLQDEDGNVAWQVPAQPGGYPFDQWRRHDVIRDPVVIGSASEAIRPATYTVSVSLWREDEAVPLIWSRQGGGRETKTGTQTWLRLGSLTVSDPSK